jgi:hypothetical protein
MQRCANTKRLGLAALLLGIAILSVGRAEAETHAVVVGINDYPNLRKLEGAVADANDISAALEKAGVTDLVTLRNGEATRKSVLGAIDQAIAKVKKDDLVIITFAGHGGRENWGTVHPPGTGTGDPHEVFLLRNVTLPNSDGKVDPKLGGSAGERIFGVEIATRLKHLDELGARTIFVADTCHGGGLTREPPSSAPSVPDTFRYVQYVAFAEGADPLLPVIPTLPAPVDTDKDLRSLSFLAAVDRVHKAPEVEIPKGSGHKRGALSYAFARVIEGDAIRGGRAELTHGDLLSYVLASIKNSSLDGGTGQEPDLRPRDNFARVAIRFGADLKSSAIPAPAPQVLNGIKIYSQNGKPVDAVNKPDRGFAIQPVGNAAEADIVYNPSTGDVFSKGGDLLAMRALPRDLEGVAEREVAMRRLVGLAQTRARPLKLDHGDRRYTAGQIMSLDARKPEGQRGPGEYYALIDISGNGKVQFEYPLEKDQKILPDALLGEMQAVEPFGADYAVFVSDEKPLDDLIASLRRLDGGKNPNAAVSVIERSLTPTMKIGLQGIYTVPK